MRRLICLSFLVFLVDEAFASDEHAPVSAPIHGAAVEEVPKVEPGKGLIKGGVTQIPAVVPNAASARSKEDIAAHNLQVKIAARLAAMRAARAAQALKLSKMKESTASAVHGTTPPSILAPSIPDPHWSYEGENGPAAWGKLSPSWSKCDGGTRQSPIDIRESFKVNLEIIRFDYKPSRYSVIDNGHTIQVNIDGGNSISVMGRTYELVQFHFHRPAEERINGKGFEMVAHLVHKDMDGKLAVVAVMIERGKSQDVIQTVWNNLPLEKNDALAIANPLDVNQMLPARREYYTYMGSLTTPPCSEGVLWLVMKEPVQASAEQLAVFARLYPFNARPIQNTSNRMIKESN